MLSTSLNQPAPVVDAASFTATVANMSSSCKYSFYPVGLPKFDSRFCDVFVEGPGGEPLRVRWTSEDSTDGPPSVHISELAGATEARVCVKRTRGQSSDEEFTVTLDPADYQGNSNRPVDLYALAETQGSAAAWTAALLGLRSHGLTDEQRAELAAVMLSTATADEEGFEDALDELYGVHPDLRTAVNLTSELLPKAAWDNTPELVAEKASGALAATGLDQSFTGVVSLIVVALYVANDEMGDWFRTLAPRDSWLRGPQLAVLAASPNNEARKFAASDVRISPYLLGQLLADDEDMVSWAAARNTSMPPEVLTQLVAYPDEWEKEDEMVYAVAANASTPPDSLAFIATSTTDTDALSYIAANPSTPVETLRWLCESPNDYVAAAAERNLGERG